MIIIVKYRLRFMFLSCVTFFSFDLKQRKGLHRLRGSQVSHQLIVPLSPVFKYMVMKLIIQGIPFNSTNICGELTTSKVLGSQTVRGQCNLISVKH